VADVAEALLGGRVLVVAPHPDDETLGCGGTIARAKALGGQVFVMVLSAGGIEQFGRGEGGTASGFVAGAQRVAEFAEAMTLLDVDASHVVYTDDDRHQNLDTVPQRELIDQIGVRSPVSIEAVRPDLMLIPARSFNQDHVACFRACMAATRPAPRSARYFVPAVLAYDNTTAFWSVPDEPFLPAVHVDITAHLETKLEALRRHGSQLRPGPYPASLDGVRTVAAYHGAQIGVAAAEAFQALRLAL
jgi:N-acetylglucosamine malate deacetylase 1